MDPIMAPAGLPIPERREHRTPTYASHTHFCLINTNRKNELSIRQGSSLLSEMWKLSFGLGGTKVENTAVLPESFASQSPG